MNLNRSRFLGIAASALVASGAPACAKRPLVNGPLSAGARAQVTEVRVYGADPGMSTIVALSPSSFLTLSDLKHRVHTDQETIDGLLRLLTMTTSDHGAAALDTRWGAVFAAGSHVVGDAYFNGFLTEGIVLGRPVRPTSPMALRDYFTKALAA